MKELAHISTLSGNNGPVPERRSPGGVAFTAGEVSNDEINGTHGVGLVEA